MLLAICSYTSCLLKRRPLKISAIIRQIVHFSYCFCCFATTISHSFSHSVRNFVPLFERLQCPLTQICWSGYPLTGMSIFQHLSFISHRKSLLKEVNSFMFRFVCCGKSVSHVVMMLLLVGAREANRATQKQSKMTMLDSS